MPLSDYILYRLARKWPSPVQFLTDRLGHEPGTEAYARAYALDQFNRRVRDGIGVAVFDREVLEIGCGHGGISCFLAVSGARRVVGIDLNTANLEHARQLAKMLESRWGADCRLPIDFREGDAYAMDFPDRSFDLVVAENAFEHFADPEKVMSESSRVLRSGGGLIVPIFSSIYSKYGLHLKHGLKLPWTNLFFSERTIVRAMHRLADEDPQLKELYPGLMDSPQRARDLRKYKDLNDITHGKFLAMAKRTGFRVEWFRPRPTRFGRLVAITPLVRKSILMDVFSTGAAAYLVKQGSS